MPPPPPDRLDTARLDTARPGTARPDLAAVVALKAGEHVKSRLSGLPDPLRRRLAWTMAVDTLTALAGVVRAVCVVSDQPGLASRLARAGLAGASSGGPSVGLASVEVLPERRRAGMNAALRDGAEHLQRAGHRGVLACVGDLPSLTPGSLRAVLAAGAPFERAFLPDASGVGTTMLLTNAGPLLPHFQGRSAAAHHGSGATALTDALLDRAVPDARRDVDTEVDLADAVRLGLGPASASLLDPATHRLGGYTVLTVVSAPGPDGRAVTAAGVRVGLRTQAVGDGLRTLRPGQRLHGVLGDGQALAVWL